MTNALINQKAPLAVANSLEKKEPVKTERTWNGHIIAIIVAGGVFIIGTVYFTAMVISRYSKSKLLSDEDAKKMIEEKFKATYTDGNGKKIDLIEKIDKLGSVHKGKVLRNLALCNKFEQQIVSDFLVYCDLTNVKGKDEKGDPTTLTPTQVVEEILKGAHIQLKDNKGLYENWKKTLPCSPRVSSHQSDSPQYGIQGPFFSTLLVGEIKKSEDNDLHRTWFQIESYPVVDLISLIAHMFAWAKYKATGKNQGAYGSSIYTDKNPLVLNPKIFDIEALNLDSLTSTEKAGLRAKKTD